MTKFKSSASSIVASSIFVIYLTNSEHFLNNVCVSGAAVTVTSPFTEI